MSETQSRSSKKELEKGSEKGSAKPTGGISRYLPLLGLGAVAALVVSQGWHKYLSLEVIAQNHDALTSYISANLFLALLAYTAIYIGVVALSLPGGAALTLAGGLLFGWKIAGPTTIIAATIGATILFVIAKTALGETLAARAGPWLSKLRDGFKENALSYLLFLRLVPAFPFWLVNLAPALLGVPFGTYVAGTFFGIIPGTMAFSFLGAGFGSVIEAQKQSYADCLAAQSPNAAGECQFTLDTSALVTTELLLAFAALGVVALIPVLIKKFSNRSSATQA